MKSILVLSFSATLALAWFTPNVRIDRASRCYEPAIAVGPSQGHGQPLYVVFRDEATRYICFQRSTDAGTTWLDENQVVCRGDYPDVTTGPDGSVYIVCEEAGHVWCTRSTDAGGTWTTPAKVDDNDTAPSTGWARVATDAAGDIFCAWTDTRTGSFHIWSSVSANMGTTWSRNVRVDGDSTNEGCMNADVFVPPGTNHYLVAASVPLYCDSLVHFHACLYGSADAGQTFGFKVQLDTGNHGCFEPHVVAEPDHVICDYTSNSNSSDQIYTEARTLYTQPDTWGGPCPVTDTFARSYYNGAKLAISVDGSVHTALLCNDVITYLIYYAYSSDHGVSWSARELVNDDTTEGKWNPDIAADSAGHVYVVWEDSRNTQGEIWFSTNKSAGIAEDLAPHVPRLRLTVKPSVFTRTTTILFCRSSPLPPLSSISVNDASGRLVRSLAMPSTPVPRPYSLVWNGCDETDRRCAPGAYLVCADGQVAKVILLPAQ